MKWKLYISIFLSLFFIIFYYLVNYKNTYTISYDIKIIQNDGRPLGELYYTNNDTYNSKNRKLIRYKTNGEGHDKSFQHLQVELRDVPSLHKLRLDPLLASGRVEVKNFNIYYLNQQYKIDFSKLSGHYKHNINISKITPSRVMVESTGDDPFIELTSNINFNKYNLYSLTQTFIYTFVLFLVFLLIQKYSLVKILSFSVLSIYTCYVLISFSNSIAFNLLTAFFLISMLMFLASTSITRFSYIKHIGFFLFFYLLIGYASLFFTTDLANPNYFYSKVPLIALAVMLPLGFYKMENFDMKYFKIILTFLLISMAILIITFNLNIASVYIEYYTYSFYSFDIYRTPWTQKNYTFWYLLLMFGTLSFYNIRKKIDFSMICLILILSYFTIFNDYSASAKLSYSLGVSTYILLSFFQIQKRHLLIFSWLFTLYIIFSPILFSFIDLASYPKLESRVAIYKTAFALIKEHWLFGYGYGSTLAIHIKDFVSTTNLPKYYVDAFPGGHPHNLALLFWLEFGLVGAIFIAYYIHKLLVYVIENTYAYISQAAVLSLIISFDIISSFSWSIWWPSVLLTFAFFGIMLTLSMNIKSLK